MNYHKHEFMTRTTVTRKSAELLFLTRELRRNTTITETEVIAIRRRWSPVRARNLGICPGEELDQLREALPMRVADAQAQKGLLWWHQQLYTKHGHPRNTAFLQACEDIEPGTVKQIRRIVKKFSHFELDDFMFEATGGGYMYPFPIYSMWSRDGESIVYVARPWQQGGSYLIS